MGLFSNKEEEVRRKRNLKELEDKRVRFAERLAAEGFRPEHCLFVQRDGGFVAVARHGGALYFLTGPAPGAEEDFTLRRVGRARAYAEDVLIKSEGLGGILGFGKKGGYGFRLIVTPEEGEPMEIEMVSGLGTYLEIRPDKRVKNALLNPKRRRGNANVVWDFQPVEREALEGVRDRWLRLVNGEDASVIENR